MARYKYSYHEERGEFNAYVEDSNGKTIWEVHYPDLYEDEETGELVESSTIFEDGFVKSYDDVEGLEDYLKSMGVLNKGDELVTDDEYAEGGEVSQSWRNNKIYAVPMSDNDNIQGKRLSYFYLHGEAEKINSYDICNANIETFKHCLYQGAFLCELIFTDSRKEDAICFSKFDGMKMEGLIVMLSDVENIKDAIRDLRFKRFPLIEDSEEKYLSSIGLLKVISDEMKKYYAEGGETDSNTFEKVKVTIRDVDMGGDVAYKGDHWFRKDQLAKKTNQEIGDYILRKYGLDYGNTYKYSIVKTGETKQKMASGGNLENKLKKKLSESFELPMEMAVYVPSTDKANIIISKRDYASRIEEVETFLSDLFGGYSAVSVDGGYISNDKGLIQEDVTRVATFGSTENFESKFTKLINKVVDWCNKWGQESMGFEFEGDMFYIDHKASFKHGGEVIKK